MSYRALLLEDDQLFAETLIDFLEDEDFILTHCNNGQSALDTLYEQKFDIYLLDINVPFVDGLTLLNELRRSDDYTPTIFLTSYKDKETMIECFKKGCDDFLKKPFDLDELLARIHALLKRTNSQKQMCGDFSIDETHHSIYLLDIELKLSLKEYQLLILLLKNANKNVTKQMIIDELWSASESISDGAIRVYINRLKQEIGSQRIENIRGVGYKLLA